MGFDQCPNYIETLWHKKDEPQPVVVKDCAPKRSLLMIQELYNRNFALQQQASQSEAELFEVRTAMTKLFEAIRYMEENKQVESQGKAKLLRHLQSMKVNEGPNQIEEV